MSLPVEVDDHQKKLKMIFGLIPLALVVSSLFGLFSEEVRITLFFKISATLFILIGGFLSLPLLYKKLKGINRWKSIGYYAMASFISLFLLVSVWTQTKKPSSTPQISEVTNFNGLANNQIKVDSQGNGNLQIQSSNGNHIVNGTNNGINGDVINNFHRPAERLLNNSDLKKIVVAIPSKDYLININYPANNLEATQFSQQIRDKLLNLGYHNLSYAAISNSEGMFKSGRFHIKREKTPIPAISIIINPQL